MSFLAINFLVLGGIGLFIYFFVESKKIKLYEMISAALYFPVFMYYLVKEGKYLVGPDSIKVAIFGVVFFEIVAIVNIYKKWNELKK